MYDSHTHTLRSPDGRQSIDELCAEALKKGIKGVAVTEHTHVSPVYQHYFPGFDPYVSVKQSIDDVLRAKEKYCDDICLGCGLEVDEYLDDPAKNDLLLALHDYDVILGSVHFLKDTRWDLQYSKIVYDNSVSDEAILDYLKRYFEAIFDMVRKTDIDVVAHLTCPLRYINGRHKRNIDISPFMPDIKDILRVMVKRNIALEVNTTGLQREEFGFTLCPDKDIISVYRDLGGSLFTLGSDAHRSESIGVAFKEAKDILKGMGIDRYHFYVKRKPLSIIIE